ncbi:hypothetical protein C0J52_27510 [Blattella germanica]|nr:hypothetical protein C0J52_27510 [Blattella germanica]
MYKRKLSGEDICRILEESDGSDGNFSEENSDYMPGDADEDSENYHVSVTSEVDDIADIENIPDIDDDETSNNINVQSTGGIFLGRNGFVWNKIPPQESKIRNVIKSQLDVVKLPPLKIQ